MLYSTVQIIVLGIYTICLLFLFVYSLGQLHLTIAYLKGIKRPSEENKNNNYLENELPFVTIQLPIYNEEAVINRLLQKTVELDYPHHLFEIQLLDDSTDQTTKIAKDTIRQLPTAVQIKHVRRTEREGFKAGALKYGMREAKGELIAIFDSDFLPEKDFLLKTVNAFKDPKIGVVQTRWGHLNENYSLLTQTQAFGLDAHFTVEQKGRNLESCFISFNGTAGVWRKTCIEEAGGWESDTLTEDLDLSYRAQLKGWKFKYLEEVVSPAELPITVGAYKSQQYRWNKGAAETHLKVWKKVWLSKLDFKTKFHALLQLFKGLGFVSSFILTLMSVPVLYYKTVSDQTVLLMQVLSFTLVCVVILTLFYYSSLIKQHTKPNKRLWYFIKKFPGFMALSLGCSFHNSVAVLEGYLKIKTPFIRTPKFNLLGGGSNDKVNYKSNVSWLTYFEGILAIYFVYALGLAFYVNDFTFLPFHMLLAFGYGFFFIYSFMQKLPWVR